MLSYKGEERCFEKKLGATYPKLYSTPRLPTPAYSALHVPKKIDIISISLAISYKVYIMIIFEHPALPEGIL